MRKDASVVTIDAKSLHADDMAEYPRYREAYEALEMEFALIDALLRARPVIDRIGGKAS